MRSVIDRVGTVLWNLVDRVYAANAHQHNPTDLR